MELIQEFVDSRGVNLRVNREQGVIEGVKVLGLVSRNGRSYLKEAAVRAIPLYEGAKVNVNHPKGAPGASRDYQDRLGQLRNVRVEAADGGLRADFHFNPKHALAEQLIWDAEHAPENVGFSHNVEARTGRGKNGGVVVEEITRVQSVDLVADPATTRGLFEQVTPDGKEDTLDTKELTEAMLVADRPDIVAAIKQAALTEHANSEAEKAKDARITALTEEVTALKAANAAAEKTVAIASELAEAKLPQGAVTELFKAQLLEAKDADARKALIEDRRKVCAAAAPRSREQRTTEGNDTAPVTDANSFVEAIT
jgi:hypothetical protein